MKNSKVFSLLLLLLLMTGLMLCNLEWYPGLEYIKSQLATWYAFEQRYPWQTAFIYLAVYIALAVLSLPGAGVMSLAAGSLFGLVEGVALVSFASTLGAAGAFLLVRHFLRDLVQRRFGHHLARLNDGLEKEGAFYLFALRLIPVLPFFVVNVLMGLTRISTITFMWVSLLGMLGSTVMLVNAGAQLAKIDSTASLASPTLVVSFAVLGLTPLLTRKALQYRDKRKGARRLL